MTLKKPPYLSPNAKDIWKDDEMGLSGVAAQFEGLISTITQPYVISLSAPYGTGKTFFAERFNLQLKEHDYKCIWINAWRDDYIGDPFSHLVSAISLDLKTQKLITEPKRKQLVEHSVKLVGKSTIPILAKSLIRLLTGLNADKEMEAFAKGLEEVTGDVAKNIIENFDKQKQSIENFKSILATAAQKNESDKPIVVFIDEFDRCRPDYAIKLLEVLKHFFDIEGYTFILIGDEEYMQACVKTCYPGLEDTSGYLRKFIDWNFRLPKPNNRQYTEYLIKVFDLDSILSDIKNDWFNSSAGVIEIIDEMSQKYLISLRDLDKIFSVINFTLRRRFAVNKPLFSPCVAYLACLREKDYKHYQGRKSAPTRSELNVSHQISDRTTTINFTNILLDMATYPQIDSFLSELDAAIQNMELRGITQDMKSLRRIEEMKNRGLLFLSSIGLEINSGSDEAEFRPMVKKISDEIELLHAVTDVHAAVDE